MTAATSDVQQPLRTVPVGAIESSSDDNRWLVNSLWPAAAVGMLCGQPKSCKTWFGLDLALSVATATPCLGHFAIDEGGPVLACLAEDSLPRARERLEGMARHRGIDIAELAVHLITEPVRLDLDLTIERLNLTIEKLQPRLLLLDPFVRMHRSNENDSGEISAILAELRLLQRRYDLAIILVHI